MDEPVRKARVLQEGRKKTFQSPTLNKKQFYPKLSLAAGNIEVGALFPQWPSNIAYSLGNVN